MNTDSYNVHLRQCLTLALIHSVFGAQADELLRAIYCGLM